MNVIQDHITTRFRALLERQKQKQADHFSLHDCRTVGICSGTAKYRLECVYRLRSIVEMGQGRMGHKQVWRVEDLQNAMKGWDE